MASPIAIEPTIADRRDPDAGLWSLPPTDVYARLATTAAGLTDAEAAARLGRYGRN
jgi:hypothetical protein